MGFYCKKCGSQLGANDRFCGNCGEKAGSADTVAEASAAAVSESYDEIKETGNTEGGAPESANSAQRDSEVEDGAAAGAAESAVETGSGAVGDGNPSSDGGDRKPTLMNFGSHIGRFEDENDDDGETAPVVENGVRDAMLGRISDSRFAGFLNGSVFLVLFYPIPFLLSVFFSGTDFSSFVYNARVLLIAISLLGGILCYAQSQSGAIAFASGTVAIGNMILAAKNNDLTFYIFSNIAVFAVICIIAIKNAYNAGGPASAGRRRASGGMSFGKKAAIIAGIAVIVIVIVAVCSAPQCSICKKLIFGEYRKFGEYVICEDCFLK